MYDTQVPMVDHEEHQRKTKTAYKENSYDHRRPSITGAF